ncbi:MAG: hypothetical protein J5546_03310 [Lachnospiraceae bacterium]|nr:hypothetical protein [Lachnospiraceae bacterium]
MKNLKKRLLVFVLSMAMCCLLFEPLTALADSEIVTPIEGFDPVGIEATFNHTCSFQNKIELNYKITANLTGYEEYWLSIERQVFSGSSDEYTWKTIRLNGSFDGERYVFTYDDIAAAEMGDLIRAKLCARIGDEVFKSDMDEYSVKEYCRRKLGGEKPSTDPDFRRLLVDTLNYGAAAQIQFEKNTNNLANDILTDDWKQEGTQGNPALVSVNNVTTIGGKTAAVANKSVSFQSGVELNLYTTYGGSTPGANVKVVLNYKTTSGKTITDTVASDKFIEDVKEGVKRYRATFKCVATADFGQPLTIKIYDGSTQISETYTYSIETYAFNRINDSASKENFKALLNAMMNYSKSANVYFSKQQQ